MRAREARLLCRVLRKEGSAMGKKMRAAVEKLEPRAYALREAVDAVKRSA